MFIPNTTPTPNWISDAGMKNMNETELKIVMVVSRKTLGWFDPLTLERKTQDYISQSQFKELTGKESAAIARAIQSSVEHGWIIARDKAGILCDTPQKRKRRKIWYQLGNFSNDKVSSSQSEQDNLVRLKRQSGSHLVANLVRKANNTKETITKENINIDNAARAAGSKNKLDDKTPMTLEEFCSKCEESKMRHINIIGMYAAQKEVLYQTRGQWTSFIKRNLRVARRLSPFTDDQLGEAMAKLKKAEQEYLKRWTLETLERYL